MANVLTTIEIRAESGRTREEIVQNLRDAQEAARSTAAEFDRLKQKSIDETAAVNKLSQELAALNLKMAQNRDAQATVSSQMTFFAREAANERKNLAELEKQLEEVTQARMQMGAGASQNSAKAQQLAADEQRLNREISQTTTSLLQHTQALSTLRGRTGELATAEETLQRGIFNSRNALLDEREALQRTNEAKQRAALENQHAATTLREATSEVRVFNQGIREQTREVNQLNASQAALAVTVGSLLSRAIRNTIEGIRDLIVDTTIYAARTDELNIVMTRLAQVNGISTGEIIAQERAIRGLNIATQDTRQVLAQFVVAQLDVSKASQLARASQDLAVIAGTDSADTFQRLTQGIETLQIRTLRTAGVFVGLDGILDKAAKTSGRTRDSFSEQEKQALLLNEVLDFGARVTGTYEEAMNNAGKQMRSLTRIIGDAKNAVGSLTVFQTTFQIIVSGIKMVLEITQAAPGAIVILSAAFAAFGLAVLSNVPAIESWTSKLVGSQGVMRVAVRETLNLGAAQRQAGQDALAAAELHMQANALLGRGVSYGPPSPGVGSTPPMPGTPPPGAGANWRMAGGIGASAGIGAGIASYAATGSVGSAIGTGVAVGAGTAATTALLTGATAATGGTLLLVAAVGALVYALVKYSNAQKEVTYASEEDMRLTLNRIKVNTEDAKALREQAAALEVTQGAYSRSAEEIRTANMALTRLSFEDQAAVRTTADRAMSVNGLSESTSKLVVQLREQAAALEKINKEQAESLIGRQTVNVTAIEAATDNLELFQKNMATALKSVRELNAAGLDDKQAGFLEKATNFLQFSGYKSDIAVDRERYNSAFTDNEVALRNQQNAYKQLGETYQQLTGDQKDYATATDEQNKVLDESIRRFLIENKIVDESNKRIDEHTEAVRKSIQARQAEIAQSNATAGVRAAYTKALGESNIKTADFSKTSVFLARTISQTATQFSSLGKLMDSNGNIILSWRERLLAGRDNLLGLDDAVRSASRSQEEYNATIAAIGERYPEVVVAIRQLRGEVSASIEGIGEDIARANQRFVSARNALLDTVRDISVSLGRGTGDADDVERRARQLELVNQRVGIVRGQIDSIDSARNNLGIDTNEAIPDTREARDDLQHTLELTIRLRDAIRDAERVTKDFVYEVAEAQATATKGILSAEMLAARNIADSQHARLQNEQDLTARVIQLSYERERRLKDEAGEQRMANQSYFAEQLESLAKIEEENRNAAAAISFNAAGQQYKLPQFRLPGGGSLRDIETPSPETVQALTATQQTAQSTTAMALNTQNMPQTLTSMLPPAIGSTLSPYFNNLTLGVDNLGATITTELGKLGDIVAAHNPGVPEAFPTEDFGNSVSTSQSTSVSNIANVIRQRAREMGFDPTIAVAQMLRESSGKMNALSPKGAGGPFQIMPGTEDYLVPQLNRRGINVNKGDRWTLEGGSFMWQQHMMNSWRNLNRQGISPQSVGADEFNKLLLAGYNAGDGNVNAAMRRAGSRTFSGSVAFLPKETQDYVQAIYGRAGRGVSSRQTTIQQTGTTTVRTPTQAELLTSMRSELGKTIALGRAGAGQESGPLGTEPLEYYRQLRQAQKANYEGLINDSRQLRIYTSAEDKAWRASAEYKIASDNKVARQRAETFRASQDDIAALDSEDRLHWRESALYRETINNQVEVARRKEFNQTFDELNRQREEDRQRQANSEQFRQTVTMKFETARRQEYNKTRERIFELNAETDTNWRQSAEYRMMLDSKVAIARRESLLASREALELLNREDADRAANPREYRERLGIDAEVERRRQARATSEELEKLNELDNQNWFNSIEYRTMLNERFEINRRNESQQTRDAIYTHQLEIANHDETMQRRMAEAYDKAQTYRQDADDQATLSIFENMSKIEDAQVVSSRRVEANLVSWMAKQRGMTDIVSDAITGTMDAAFNGIDKLIGKVTDRAGDFGSVMQGILGGFIKLGLTNLLGELSGAGKDVQQQGKGFFGQVLSSFGLGHAQAATQSSAPLAPMHVPQMFVSQLYVGGTIGGNIGGPSGAFGGFGGLFNQQQGGGLNPYAPGGTGTFSGGPAFSVGGSQAQGPMTSPGIASVFGSQYGHMLPADLQTAGGTAIANASAPGAGNIGSSLGSVAGKVISGSGVATVGALTGSAAKWASKMGGNAWGGVKGFSSGIGASLATMLPGIGGSLGGMLGGPSMVGSIMGQVGGLALGGVGMAALMGQTAVAGMFGGGAFGGAMAGLLTNPITAVVGGALLVGAFIYGRNKRRQQEEKARNQALGDAKTQLQQLLKNVQRDRLDGASAIAQAEDIRTQYMASMSQLKDGKTRSHALASVRELDSLIAQIKNAATAQERRQEFNDSLVPEFASGGIVNSTGMGMVVPGMDMGYDSVPAMLRPGEVVLNKQQQAALGGPQALAAARVPGFVKQTAVTARRYAEGGVASATMPSVSTVGAGSRAGGTSNIFVVMDKKFAQDMAVQGRDKIIEMSATDIRDRGKIYAAVRKI